MSLSENDIAALFDDPNFVGLLMNFFMIEGDERLDTQDPIFLSRHVGLHVFQELLSHNQIRLDAGLVEIIPLFTMN